MITTWPVLTEAVFLVGAGTARQAVIFDLMKSDQFELFPLQREQIPRMADLMAKYADLPMDLADASLVVAAEIMRTRRILTLDERDFSAYRVRIGRESLPFDLL